MKNAKLRRKKGVGEREREEKNMYSHVYPVFACLVVFWFDCVIVVWFVCLLFVGAVVVLFGGE